MLFHPGAEQRPVDRPRHRQRSDEPFGPQRPQKRRRLPTTARRLFNHTRAERRATIGARHVGLGPCFVEENDFVGIDLLLQGSPLQTFLGDIRPILLAGNQRLFFRVCSNERQALQIVIRQTLTPSSDFRSACNSRR